MKWWNAVVLLKTLTKFYAELILYTLQFNWSSTVSNAFDQLTTYQVTREDCDYSEYFSSVLEIAWRLGGRLLCWRVADLWTVDCDFAGEVEIGAERERERRTGDGCYDLMYSNCTVLYCTLFISWRWGWRGSGDGPGR